MIVGTEVTCPQCQQTDGTQRVSLLANMIQGNMTPREMDILNMDVSRGVAQEWRGEPKNGSWEGLAKLLAPPPKPELDSLARMLRSLSRMRYSALFGFLLILVSFLAFRSAALPTFGFAVPFFCIFWVAMLFATWRLILYSQNAEKRLAPKLEEWTRGMQRWNHLYYCVRDNRVFDPGKRKTVAPEQMAERLSA